LEVDAASAIHLARQSDGFKNPISQFAGALQAVGCPALSQTRTFHHTRERDASGFPP
jgi:hypothetical protein